MAVGVTMKIIAGDIGGTNTRLIFTEINDSERLVLAESNYLCAEYSDFVQVLNIFISENGITLPVDTACFAIAGPVESTTVSVTNLPWVIHQQQLCDVLDTPHVTLINDFIAVAHGISELSESDVLVLQQGLAEEGTSLHTDAVVVGAGTGLGASHLVWLNDHYKPYPSEAGHVGFAPGNAQQTELLAWMQRKHTHVSLEWLLSGKGLLTIYRFLHEVAGIAESPGVSEAMQANDPAQVITANALSEEDLLCQKTVDMFIDIYGSAAGNVALHYYPVDELYIAGGIAAKIHNRMRDRRFTEAFNDKGAMTSVMQKITIKLIMQDKVGLYGALAYAHWLYNDDMGVNDNIS